MKQFKPNDDVDALKNLAEEFVDVGNVHHQLQEVISREIVRIMIHIQEMITTIVQILENSETKRDLYE